MQCSIRSNLDAMASYIAFDEKEKLYKIPTKKTKLCSQFGDVVSVVEKMRRQFSDEVIIQIPEEMFVVHKYDCKQ